MGDQQRFGRAAAPRSARARPQCAAPLPRAGPPPSAAPRQPAQHTRLRVASAADRTDVQTQTLQRLRAHRLEVGVVVVHPWLMHVQTRSCQAGGSVVRGGTRSPGHDVLVAAEWQMTARRADAPAACLAAPCRLHLPLNAENRVESARLIRDRASGAEVRPAPPRRRGGAGTPKRPGYRRWHERSTAGPERPADPNELLP